MGNWTIETENPFVVILITDLSEKGDLSETEKILVSVVARARNTGMEYEYVGDDTFLKRVGDKPLLLEPVKATISVKNMKNFEVVILDHDGRLTNRKTPVKNGVFEIDGSRDKSLYYLIISKSPLIYSYR